MGRHVIGPFIDVGKHRIAIGRHSAHESFKVMAYRRISILAKNQRGAGVLDKHVAQTIADATVGDNPRNVGRNIEGSATRCFNNQFV